jgi:predicted Zn-dependent protease
MIAIGLAGLRIPLLPKDLNPDQEPLVAAAGNAAWLFMSGDDDNSKKAFEDVFHSFPAARNTHYLYGYLLYPTDPDAALAQFQHELEIVPSNTDAAIMGAWILLLHDRAAEALPLAQRAAEQEPQSVAAQAMLGRSLLETGDLQSSIARLERAVKVEPDNLELHIALAKAYSKSGRKDDARRERMFCLRLTQTHAAQLANP